MIQIKYYRVEAPVRHEVKIRRSSFIGSLAPAVERQSAEDTINRIRTEFPDATHNCFAYRIDRDVYRYYDDGEPGSTAGKPILAMLDKYHLLQCVLVVTRYYGGTKLGVGGLISAYSNCAEETIQRATLQERIEYRHFRLSYGYHFTRQVEYIIAKYYGAIIKSEYLSAVTTIVHIPLEHSHRFETELAETGNGQIDINLLGD